MSVGRKDGVLAALTGLMLLLVVFAWGVALPTLRETAKAAHESVAVVRDVNAFQQALVAGYEDSAKNAALASQCAAQANVNAPMCLGVLYADLAHERASRVAPLVAQLRSQSPEQLDADFVPTCKGQPPVVSDNAGGTVNEACLALYIAAAYANRGSGWSRSPKSRP